MITVKVIRNQENDVVSFTMSGHAESGPYGQDLVCAGASAVSFGTVNAIDEICNVQLEIEMKDNGGFLRCVVPTNLEESINEKVQLLLEGMIVSLQSIAAEYGKHIKIIEKTGGE